MEETIVKYFLLTQVSRYHSLMVEALIDLDAMTIKPGGDADRFRHARGILARMERDLAHAEETLK